jgi:catechol 2,3-dioxygenase-like lactoylglutathione lyase family enzyme
MDVAVNFYRDGLSLTPVSRSPGWSIFACGDALVGLHLIEPGVPERPVPHAGLNLLVDELEKAVQQAVDCGAALVELEEPHRASLPRLAVMLAPDGNGFELRDR